MEQNVRETSGTYRAIEIILGLLAVAIGILGLIFPEGIVVTLIVLFGIALLIVGILRLATAYAPHMNGSARTINAVIGGIAIIIAIIMLVFPTAFAITLTVLVGIGLMVYGVGRIVVGGVASVLPGGLRALTIILGVIIALLGILVIFVPALGVLTYAVFVSLSFILIGIDSLAAGIMGRRLTRVA